MKRNLRSSEFFCFFIHTRSSKEKKNENWILPRSLFTSSSSSSEPSTLPPEWPGCPSAPSPSSSGLSLCKTKSRKTKIHSLQKPLVVPGLVERSVVVLQYYSMYSLDLANTRSIISFEFIWCRHRYSSTLSSVPVHDLTELLSGQEAWVLPDLPQSSLELLLVLVFESLLVPLLFAAASLLAVVQPEECHRGWSDISNTHTPCGLHTARRTAYTSTILGVNSFRGIGFFFSNTSRLLGTEELLMFSRMELWSSWHKNNHSFFQQKQSNVVVSS